ncbi:hypothetical protein DPX16_5543 [Anabarilius grahami]|uniref:LINE-1 type transposase domain-containing protein 1 n=1 Tax=Anabarilius grahami TaxID=495550 RepID=A0A3N0YB00_ANAGA|nr:hypothetical protein DPX16_5543 [Anabarilius grahami]
MPKAKKIAPKSSTISGDEHDANMDDVSVKSREEESSNSNFAQALDKLTENITKVIDEKVNTVLAAINYQTVQFQALVERVGQAEERIAGVENSTESLRATVVDLQKKVSEMSAHIDDLENRGRRCNLRLVGLPEGTEGSDPVMRMMFTLCLKIGSRSPSVFIISVCVCSVTSSDLQLQRLHKDHSSENGKDSNYLHYPSSSASLPSLHLHTSHKLSWFK